MPHPDDESEGWSLVRNSSDNYPVFIYLTEGEGTGFCDPPGSAWQQSYNERFPGQYPGFDNYPGMPLASTPWDGKETGGPYSSIAYVHDPGCRQARMNSAQQFIGDLGNADPTVPQFWPGQNAIQRICFSGIPEPSKDPCAYYLANNVGAEIFFDLGDRPQDWNLGYSVSPNDVVWAIQKVYQNMSSMGIPYFPLGVHNIIGAAFYNSTSPGSNTPQYHTSAGTSCQGYGHWNHYAVQVALWQNTILPNVYNYGRTCSGDSDAATAAGGRIAFATGAASNFGVSGNPLGTFYASGPGTVDYGWLDLHAFPWGIVPALRTSDLSCRYPERRSQTESGMGCVQAFWRRGGSPSVTHQY